VARRTKIRDAESAPEFREAVVRRWRQIVRDHFTHPPEEAASRPGSPPPARSAGSVGRSREDRFLGGRRFDLGDNLRRGEDDDADDDED
jgi:hypothetical protein